LVDKELLLRKTAELEEYLDQISEYENLSIKQYSGDWKVQRIIERTLQMMIEICVDTASHIISDKGYRVPKSYADTFRVLFENKIIEESLFERMEKMAKFRNIVVHHYDKVDEEIVVGILRKDINDFMEYKDAIINFLKKKKTP
jgi:uncharacterized protein YutE (UPF0331/DUF86 family)